MAKGKKSEANQLNYKERRLRVLELRKAGASYRNIAKAVGCSHEQVRKDLAAVHAELLKEQVASADELRAMESERIDMARLAIAPQVKQGHLGAVREWRALGESYRKLWGLDAPEKREVTGNLRVRHTRELTHDELMEIASGGNSSE